MLLKSKKVAQQNKRSDANNDFVLLFFLYFN